MKNASDWDHLEGGRVLPGILPGTLRERAGNETSPSPFQARALCFTLLPWVREVLQAEAHSWLQGEKSNFPDPALSEQFQDGQTQR